jgi:predicted ATPase/class 3 adenylate cyclase
LVAVTHPESGASRPAATVAFLFADLEGSTRLLASLGAERYGEVLSGYRMIVAEAAAPEGGEVIDREGDGLFLVFPTAAGALRAASNAQRAIAVHTWPDGSSVAARMGVHAGEARREGGSLLGLDVHRAARVASAAHGGQVLVSETARLLAADGLPAELQLMDLGEHRVKDFARPERLCQLVAPGLRRNFAPVMGRGVSLGNLPLQATSFVGREAEFAYLLELVRANRLVTVTGVGGSGKTRLTLQVAAELAPEAREGVRYVELAAITDPSLVDSAALRALEVDEQPGTGPRASLLSALAPAQMLLVVDNCEHLLDAAADLVAAILGVAPGVRLMTTSRELLGVEGEAVYGLRSMSLPTADGSDPEELARYDAVRLFTERAAAVLPGFKLDADNAPAVAEICRRLDGMPLALELAAPRLRTFSPARLAQLLDQRFRLLTGGRRTALPRQQTLNATIDWSYRLLAEPEREFFRRLAVFQGGFTYEATAAVYAGDEGHGDPLELLPALVDKSLVLAEGEAGEIRYRLLETIRQFARERLDESNDGEQVRGSHARYYHNLLLEAASNAAGPDERAWRVQMKADADNLRQAMTWLLDAARPIEALEMAVARARFFGGSEARTWLERSMGAAWAAADDLLRAQALYVRAVLRDDAGLPEEAVADIEQAIDLYRGLDAAGASPALAVAPSYAGALIARAVILFHHGRAGANNEVFTQLVQEALDTARRLDDRHAIALALGNLAHHRDPHGDPDQARMLFSEALAATRALGSDQLLAGISQQRAFFEFAAGDLEASRDAWREAVRYAELAWQIPASVVYRAYLAAVEVALGADAAGTFISNVRLIASDRAQEMALLYQNLIVFRAGIDAARGENHRVAQAAGASAAEAERGVPVRWDLTDYFEAVTGRARQALGDEAFEAEVRRGAAMSREQIAEFLGAD